MSLRSSLKKNVSHADSIMYNLDCLVLGLSQQRVAEKINRGIINGEF